MIPDYPRFYNQDILYHDLELESFDLILFIHSLSHIGVNTYGNGSYTQGPQKALKRSTEVIGGRWANSGS